MPRRPDTPCAGCGNLIWSGSGSLPPGERLCQPCRAKRKPAAWSPHKASCSGCKQSMWMDSPRRRYCDRCRRTSKRRTRNTTTAQGAPLTPSQQARSGRPRRRATARVRATQPNCHLCGYPIDLTLDRQRHPLGSCVDEIIPVHYDGSIHDPGNLGHAHRVCNTSRGIKPITPEVRDRCRALVEAALRRTEVQVNAW